MIETGGQGLPLPSVGHAPSLDGDAPPVALHCIFGCLHATIESHDPWAAHQAMEAHYHSEHAEVIAQAAGVESPRFVYLRDLPAFQTARGGAA